MVIQADDCNEALKKFFCNGMYPIVVKFLVISIANKTRCVGERLSFYLTDQVIITTNYEP